MASIPTGYVPYLITPLLKKEVEILDDAGRSSPTVVEKTDSEQGNKAIEQSDIRKDAISEDESLHHEESEAEHDETNCLVNKDTEKEVEDDVIYIETKMAEPKQSLPIVINSSLPSTSMMVQMPMGVVSQSILVQTPLRMRPQLIHTPSGYVQVTAVGPNPQIGIIPNRLHQSGYVGSVPPPGQYAMIPAIVQAPQGMMKVFQKAPVEPPQTRTCTIETPEGPIHVFNVPLNHTPTNEEIAKIVQAARHNRVSQTGGHLLPMSSAQTSPVVTSPLQKDSESITWNTDSNRNETTSPRIDMMSERSPAKNGLVPRRNNTMDPFVLLMKETDSEDDLRREISKNVDVWFYEIIITKLIIHQLYDNVNHDGEQRSRTPKRRPIDEDENDVGHYPEKKWTAEETDKLTRMFRSYLRREKDKLVKSVSPYLLTSSEKDPRQ